MRVPGLRAHVQLELAAIDGGEEVLAQERIQRRCGNNNERKKDDQKNRRMVDAQHQDSLIAAAKLLEVALEPELEPRQRIAAGLLASAASSSCSCSRYLAMVGTTVRDRM